MVFRNPPAVVKGIAEFRKLIASLRGAFPDLHFTLEDELAEGNKVATRWVMRGTQGARKVDVSGMDIFLIENGKIREIWVNMDSLAQAQQMGAVPAQMMMKTASALSACAVVLVFVRQPCGRAASALCRSRARARDSRRAR